MDGAIYESRTQDSILKDRTTFNSLLEKCLEFLMLKHSFTYTYYMHCFSKQIGWRGSSIVWTTQSEVTPPIILATYTRCRCRNNLTHTFDLLKNSSPASTNVCYILLLTMGGNRATHQHSLFELCFLFS